MANRRRVWTDGACKGNPGPGGWAWVGDDGRWARGAEARSTNQRMEITAAYRAVLANEGPLTVVSDSTYVVNCFRDGWWRGWLAKDWKNSQRKPVANRDLWEPFIEEYQRRGDVVFEWVKGHAGDEMNDIADRLAVAAAEDQREASGDRVPDDLGEADVVPGAAAAPDRDPRLPAGHLVGVFGARPPELGGWDANPVSDAVGRRLQEILAAKARMHPDLAVVSGLRLGAEMLGAEAAVAEGLPLVAVLPFPDADAPWPEAARRRFAALREAAATEVLLERKVPDSKQKVAGSLRRRDAWLARNLDEAIVVWDGAEPFVGRLVGTLRDHLGDDVWEEPVPAVPG
ncbi:MAG: ribonuclease H [Acidimicrobiia bacterium]